MKLKLRFWSDCVLFQYFIVLLLIFVFTSLLYVIMDANNERLFGRNEAQIQSQRERNKLVSIIYAACSKEFITQQDAAVERRYYKQHKACNRLATIVAIEFITDNDR